MNCYLPLIEETALAAGWRRWRRWRCRAYPLHSSLGALRLTVRANLLTYPQTSLSILMTLFHDRARSLKANWMELRVRRLRNRYHSVCWSNRRELPSLH